MAHRQQEGSGWPGGASTDPTENRRPGLPGPLTHTALGTRVPAAPSHVHSGHRWEDGRPASPGQRLQDGVLQARSGAIPCWGLPGWGPALHLSHPHAPALCSGISLCGTQDGPFFLPARRPGPATGQGAPSWPAGHLAPHRTLQDWPGRPALPTCALLPRTTCSRPRRLCQGLHPPGAGRPQMATCVTGPVGWQGQAASPQCGPHPSAASRSWPCWVRLREAGLLHPGFISS